MNTAPSFLQNLPPDIRSFSVAIIECQSFQRLKRVSFLGAIDRLSKETNLSSGSRYDHSLGVAEIMCSISGQMGLSPGELRLAIANALLHDIGHGPFSHSSEPFFSKAFRLDHHVALQSIVEDDSSEVSVVLKRFGLWLDYRRFVRRPSSIPAVHRLYYGPINVDTIEGIIRAAKFFKIDTPLDPSILVHAIGRRHLGVRHLDQFWDLKSQVYNEHIFADRFALYDEAFTCALTSVRERVRAEHFYCDDDQFEVELGEGLQMSLTHEEGKVTVRPHPRVRRFQINKNAAPRQFGALESRYSEVRGSNANRSDHNR